MSQSKLQNLYLNIRLLMKGKSVFDKVNSLDGYIPGRELTFEEDFNSPVINTDKWNTHFNWETNIPVKVDVNNIEIKDSVAHFLVKEEFGNIDGKLYFFTRPHLDTSGKFSQMYGRFEAKCKVKNIKGLFPAFWTLSNVHMNMGKESIKPEIDILEHFDNNEGKKQIGCSLHYGITYNVPDSKRTSSYIKWVDFSDKWVVYAVEWTKEGFKWYINNELVKIFNTSSMLDYEKPTTAMYLIINENVVHLETMIKNERYLPDGMEVDWIRVYK